MTVAAHDRRHRRPDVEVRVSTDVEFRAARKRALDSIGLTYAELEQQARRGRFDSPRARKVWMSFGDRPI